MLISNRICEHGFHHFSSRDDGESCECGKYTIGEPLEERYFSKIIDFKNESDIDMWTYLRN